MSEINSGAVLLRPASDARPERTLLVIGFKRSGTSAVARLLQLLGVPMGDATDPVMVEDRRLGDALKARWGGGATLDAVIADYDARHAVWGFKLPARNRALLRHIDRFRAPRIVLVMRDAAAVAGRVSRGDVDAFAESVVAALEEQRRLFRGVRDSGVPALVLSYEKLLGSPEPTLATLLDFCGLPADAATIARCLHNLSPNRNDYTRTWSRPAPGLGYVDHLSRERIGGWATLGFDSAPVEVQLCAGETVIARVNAEESRLDVRDAGVHHSGLCGFRFDLRALAGALPEGAQRLSVRIAATGFELHNSPIDVSRP